MRSLGGDWVDYKRALVARLEHQGQSVYLVKLLAKVNSSGTSLVQLAAARIRAGRVHNSPWMISICHLVRASADAEAAMVAIAASARSLSRLRPMRSVA